MRSFVILLRKPYIATCFNPGSTNIGGTTMLRRRLTCAMLVTVIAVLPVTAQTRPAIPAEKLDRIEKAISSEMSRQSIPGLSVAIVIDHQLAWSSGYGLA